MEEIVEEIATTDDDIVCLGYVERTKPSSPRFLMRKVRISLED
jgi:hypothetical protein